MATDCGDKIRSLIASVTFAADNPSKFQNLHQLKHQLLKSVQDSSISLSDFLPSLLKLLSDDFSPVRKCISEYVTFLSLIFSFSFYLISFRLNYFIYLYLSFMLMELFIMVISSI